MLKLIEKHKRYMLSKRWYTNSSTQIVSRLLLYFAFTLSSIQWSMVSILYNNSISISLRTVASDIWVPVSSWRYNLWRVWAMGEFNWRCRTRRKRCCNEVYYTIFHMVTWSWSRWRIVNGKTIVYQNDNSSSLTIDRNDIIFSHSITNNVLKMSSTCGKQL